MHWWIQGASLLLFIQNLILLIAVADPGSPMGGRGPIGGGCGPPTQALFGKNVCENGELDPIGGACTRHTP